MALSTNRVTAVATPGMAAAATARPASGGRNVASATGGPVESVNFAPQTGVQDNRILRYDEEFDFDFNDESAPQHQGTPFVIRQASAFSAESVEDQREAESPRTFLGMVLRGVGAYESNMRVTAPGSVRPGSVMNYLY